MSFIEWLLDTSVRVRADGINGALQSGRELYIGGLRRLNEVYPQGTNIYDREWDMLILLDGCRTDLMREVEDEWPFLDRRGTLTSLGSSSLQWLERTFMTERLEELNRTAYVTANPFTHRISTTDDLLELDELWRDSFDDEHGTILARSVTDRAVRAARETNPERLIVHYMQPHFPSVPDPIGGELTRETLGEGAGWESPWDRLQRGELEYERVWESYRLNLEYVLKEVSILLQNVDAERVVISADHGNAAGEWGVYGHPRVPLRVVREVPWYRTTATDEGTFTPNLDRGVDQSAVSEKLKALGYLD